MRSNRPRCARKELKTIAARYPKVTFNEVDAPADYTQKSLNGVLQSLIEGIMLTAVVLMLFLHAWRNARRRDDRDPEFAALDVHRDEAAGLHSRHRLADGPLADHRYSGRRFDRRPREHHAASRHGRSARRCGDQRPQRDRRRGGRDHAGRRRRLPADRVSLRHRRQVHGGVRHRRRRRDAVLAVRLVHAHADARGALVGEEAQRGAAALAGVVPDRVRPLHALVPRHRVRYIIKHRWMAVRDLLPAARSTRSRCPRRRSSPRSASTSSRS